MDIAAFAAGMVDSTGLEVRAFTFSSDCFHTGQSVEVVAGLPRQLEQVGEDASQQSRMDLRWPPFAHVGIGHRWAKRVCRREHRGQTGSSLVHPWVVWPNCQHFLHWVEGEADHIMLALRALEKRGMEEPISHEMVLLSFYILYLCRFCFLFWICR
jgi:hypothetical protein